MKVGLELDLYGVHVRITAPDELAGDIKARLRYASELSRPGGADLGLEAQVSLWMDISAIREGKYFVSRDGEELIRATGEGAVDYLETQIRQQVSMRSPDKIFIHAGVVGFNDQAIVVPGLSHSGKTSLVAALLEAGATYLSDEYAVLDTQGLVHPFSKPLSVRREDGSVSQLSVPAPGGAAVTSALPVRLVVLSTYREGATWRPTHLSDGDGLLKLLRHTAQTRDRPAATLAALRRMVEGAKVLIGERGEAAELAPVLLDALAGPG